MDRMSTSPHLGRRALQIGPIALDAPVVLAPMAGITNTAFRRLCREYGAGLYVSEMITTRALVERNATTMRLITHHESETPARSSSTASTRRRPKRPCAFSSRRTAPTTSTSTSAARAQGHAQGRGAALPWKTGLFREIVTRAARAAGDVPLTVKMRKGIDADHLTFLDAGRIAEDAGVAAVALHARTAAEFYPATPTGRRSRLSSRPSRASRCSATATSGRRTTLRA
jgi:tRNA-dihydrouridine synthase